MNKDLHVAFTVQIGEKKKSVSEINRHKQMYGRSRLSEFEGAALSSHFTVALHCLRKRNLSKCHYSQIYPEQENSGCHRIPTTLTN